MTNKQIIDHVDKNFGSIQNGLLTSLRILKEASEHFVFSSDIAQSAFRIAVSNLEIDLKHAQIKRQDTWNFLQMVLPLDSNSKDLIDEARYLQDCEPESDQKELQNDENYVKVP